MAFPSGVSLSMVNPQVGVELEFCCALLCCFCLNEVHYFSLLVIWTMLVLPELRLGAAEMSWNVTFAVWAGATLLDFISRLWKSAVWILLIALGAGKGSRREVSAQVSAHAGLEGRPGALDMLRMSRCSLDCTETHRILSQASLADEREIVCSDLEWIK